MTVAAAYFKTADSAPDVTPDMQAQIASYAAGATQATAADRTMGSIMFGGRYQSNANGGASSPLVDLNGIEFQLNSAAMADPDANGFVAGNLHYSHDLASQGDKLDADISVYGSVYGKHDDLDTAAIEAEFGPVFNLERFAIAHSTLGIYGIAGAVGLKTDPYLYTAGVGTVLTTNFDPATQAQLRLEYRYEDYINSDLRPTVSDMTGSRIRLTGNLRHQVTPALAVYGSAYGERKDAVMGFDADWEAGALDRRHAAVQGRAGEPAAAVVVRPLGRGAAARFRRQRSHHLVGAAHGSRGVRAGRADGSGRRCLVGDRDARLSPGAFHLRSLHQRQCEHLARHDAGVLAMMAMRLGLVLLLSTGLLPGLAGAAFAQSVGVAAAVNQTAFGTPPSQKPRTMVLGDQVIHNEKINTNGKGLLQILLADGTSFTVGPNSSMVIDSFVYDPDANTAQVVATLGKGVFRFIGGRTSKSPDGAVLKTPVGTVGIRGGISDLDFSRRKGIPIHIDMLFGDSITLTNGGTLLGRLFQNGYSISLGAGNQVAVVRTPPGWTQGFQSDLAGRGGHHNGGPAPTQVASALQSKPPPTSQPATATGTGARRADADAGRDHSAAGAVHAARPDPPPTAASAAAPRPHLRQFHLGRDQQFVAGWRRSALYRSRVRRLLVRRG